MKSIFKNKLLWCTFIFYILILLIFQGTQKEMAWNNYMIMIRQALPPMIIIYLIQSVNKKSLLSPIWFPTLSIGLFWFMLIPILQSASNETMHHWNPRFDIMWGIYLMIFFMLLQSILVLFRNRLSPRLFKISMLIFSFFVILSLMIPIAELGHFLIYGVTISDSSILAIQDTYLQEALGYLQTYVGPIKLGILFLFLSMALYLTYRTGLTMNPVTLKKSSILLLILFPIVTIYTFGNLKEKSLFFKAWKRVSDYQYEQSLFTQDYDNRYNSIYLTSPATALSKTNPGTDIIIIGESASRDYMKTYTPDFPYNDTPWLDSCRNDKNFIVYNNVYSCYNQTVEALMRACTEMSQYNDKQFNHSITFIDIAKKAGYHTYWFTNQGGMGENDAPITLIMKTTDHYESPSISNRLHYDGDLLPLLKEVDPHQNNFIVIHLLGSHAPYQARYPQENEQFDASSHEGNYANSILYTDTILRQIFEYGQKNMNLKVMLYFSDHGENVYTGHNPDVKTFDNVRIPMFIYLSPDYQQQYPQKYTLLKNRTNSYFTNDMIYNTICGVLNSPSNHYDANEDFSSPSYDFTKDTLWTFKHTVPISNDPKAM